VNRDFASNLFEDNGGKAAALHPDAVDWLSSEIDVFVTNPSQFDRGVTRITASPLHGRAPRVDTVAVTPVPAAVLVKGGGMADRPGVFSAILSQFGAVSIGHAPSDALTVLVTFHEAAALERLPALKAALSSMGNFEVDPVERHSWIHCLGNHLDGRERGRAHIFLADAGVSGDWSIGSPGGIKFLVPNDSVQTGVNALHDGLIRPY
jgi:aspartokinase